MIKLAVTDANIFIDLIILGLIDHFFGLEILIHTTREVFDQLTAKQKEVLYRFHQRGQVIIYDFTAVEMLEIHALAFPSGSEPADRTVFYYAMQLACMVISGDNKLKKYCQHKGLEVHGLIWVFDQLVIEEIITSAIAAEKLEKLMNYNNRLPSEELFKRIKMWR